MKPLIAVITCHKNRIAAHAIRETWAKNSPIEVKFFFGTGNRSIQFSDEVFLSVPDTYLGLPEKVKAVTEWAYSRGYDFLLKCDDDSYVVPDRIQFTAHHAGWWAPPTLNISGQGPSCLTGYIHGGAGYILSSHCMDILRQSPITSISEDWWVTDTLYKAGIQSENRDTHVYQRRTLGDPFPLAPTKENNIAVSAEYAPQELMRVHREFVNAERLAEDRMSADEYKKYIKEKRV